jgi:hypothetical protein
MDFWVYYEGSTASHLISVNFLQTFKVQTILGDFQGMGDNWSREWDPARADVGACGDQAGYG